MSVFFPFADYWWFYLTFIAVVLVLLALDLGVFHRNPHRVSFKEAAAWSGIWVSVALIFNVFFYWYSLYRFNQDPRLLGMPGFSPEASARQVALEFLTGYIVEKSLAVDNIFVFLIVFSYFSIPPKYQHRVLFYGILGALLFRGIFIALGSILMSYHALVIIFGAFLIFTGIKMFFAPEKPIDPSKNRLLKFLEGFLPLTPTDENGRFILRKDGRIMVTPLFLALIFVEMCDIVFAVDSVPAIFALTKEPLIVFTSNVCAILGLRAMYFLLASVADKFHMLKYGLGLVLVFVGVKMVWLNDYFDGEFPISWSLMFTTSVIGISIVLSLLIPSKHELDVDTLGK